MPAGDPAALRIDLVSPDYPTDATLTYDLVVEQSFDDGVTFAPWFSLLGDHGGGLGAPGKFGVPGTGLPQIALSYDGLARLARVTVTVNQPFVWGLTATVL